MVTLLPRLRGLDLLKGVDRSVPDRDEGFHPSFEHPEKTDAKIVDSRPIHLRPTPTERKHEKNLDRGKFVFGNTCLYHARANGDTFMGFFDADELPIFVPKFKNADEAGSTSNATFLVNALANAIERIGVSVNRVCNVVLESKVAPTVDLVSHVTDHPFVGR